ncbi:putative palmitoyltransferase ZDHHC24 [Halotydeus destructor]|nr:putative palmitoyltransferase ZDHHC24 [Halotydeus destructor]
MSRRFNSLSEALPKNVSDGFAVIFSVSAILITFMFELTTVIPYVHTSNTWRLVHSVLGSFIVHNILGNLWLIMATDTSTRRTVLTSTTKPGWRFCACCESNTPPRTFHCPSCDRCILRRDHHCTFAGKCIGYFNFRYFWALLFHISIGSAYAAILNMFFIWQPLGGFNWTNLVKHTFPIIFWLTGRLPTIVAIWTFISVIDLAAMLFAFGLLVYHSSLMAANQTNHEKNKNITTYNLFNWKDNVAESLGQNWHLVLISPLISSKLPRDGVKFPNYKEYHLQSSKSK